MEIHEGQRWCAKHSRGRKDAIVFIVSGVTELGIYVTSPESRFVGNLYAKETFVKLFYQVI